MMAEYTGLWETERKMGWGKLKGTSGKAREEKE